MKIKDRKKYRRYRIKMRVRKKIRGTENRPRLSVYRSNKQIYVQLIDDEEGKTIMSASSAEKEIDSSKGNKVQIAAKVGELISKKATEEGIKEVVFDRNGYLYHGRIKALGDAARKGGLKF